MKALKVLSLFDGISCGMVALERAGIPVEQYYASEIEGGSIKISQKNYPTIIQLGNVVNWKDWQIDWKDIDLLIGGSPCQGFSVAGKKAEFNDERSKLVFTYIQILNHIKSVNPNILFLLENVKMRKECEEVISEFLGVKPILLNSNVVSAQNRLRLYWTNIQDVKPLKEKNCFLKDVFEPQTKHREIFINYPETMVKKKNYIQYDQNKRGNNSQDQRLYYMNGKSGTLLLSSSSIPKVEYNGRYWLFTPEECEKLQTLPREYTKADGVSNSKRYEAIGNGWTVDVIAHILKGVIQ